MQILFVATIYYVVSYNLWHELFMTVARVDHRNGKLTAFGEVRR